MPRMFLALLAAFALPAAANAQGLGLLYLPAPPVQSWAQPAAPAPAKAAARPILYRTGENVLPAERTTRPALPLPQSRSHLRSEAQARPILFSAAPKDLRVWEAPVRTFVRPVREVTPGRLRYGPFRVRAEALELVGATDASSPDWFARALRENPGIVRLDMIECPGTHDDRANLRLGRMIRAAGLATHVPAHGSVRSGAVELFLAGAGRSIEEGAEFAVHSWRDVHGREAEDYAPDAPPNRTYLDYYRDMGMDEGQARAFYAFTNSVPHHRARWLEAAEMRRWTVGGARLAAR